MKKSKRLLTMLLAVAMILTFMPAMAFAEEAETLDFTKLTVTCLDYSSRNNTVNTSEIGDPQDIDIFNPQSSAIKVKAKVLDTKSGGTAVYYDYTATIPTDETHQWGTSGSIMVHDSNETAHSFFVIDSTKYDTQYHRADINGLHGFYSWADLDSVRPEKKKSPIQIDIADIVSSANGKVTKTLDVVMPIPANSSDNPSDTTVALEFDFNNVEIFEFGTNPINAPEPDPDDVVLWSRGGTIYDCNATDAETGLPKTKDNNDNKISWAMMRSEELVKDLNDNIDTYYAVLDEMDAAKAAMKTPGDAAVAAAQKAVDAVQASRDACDKLDELKDNADKKYIKSAKDFAAGKDEEVLDPDLKIKAADDADSLSEADAIVTNQPLDLGEIEKEANANLTQAKAECAEVKAEAAAAEAAALRYTPVKAKIKSAKGGKKKVNVSFKKLSNNVTGYEVQIVDKKTGAVVKTVNVAKSKKKVIKKTVKGLKKKTKYTAMVRAYNTVNGKTYYGAWSKAKGFKTR